LLENVPLLDKYYSYQKEKVGNNYSFYLILMIFIIFFIVRKKIISTKYNYRYFIILMAISVMFTYIGFEMVFVKRISSYFEWSTTIILSIFPMVFVKKEQKLVSFIVAIYG